MTADPGFVQRLRAASGLAHDRVDAAFGAFRLDDRDDYAAFLTAHARALPAVEAALAAHPDLPSWRERTSLLSGDLADLGRTMPALLPFAPDGDAAAWGALYVTEGSRLGGTLLARSVAAGWPSRYLGARHLPGEWRALLAAIETRAADAPPEWQAAAVAGAMACFALYERAA